MGNCLKPSKEQALPTSPKPLNIPPIPGTSLFLNSLHLCLHTISKYITQVYICMWK